MKLPLEGITVIAVEHAIAAPFATRQLADLGARVIKVERPGAGDFARKFDSSVRGLSSNFVWTNRSKESLTLNLKDSRGRQVLERLLAKADVFVQNLAPGTAERLGFGASRLRSTYPRLIVCSITGYGSSGPYSGKKAYDLLIQCETGLVSITGTPEAPSRVGISVADIAGGMYAFSGILAALYRRAEMGEGLEIDVSLFDALAEWMSYPLYYTTYGGKAPERTGASHPIIAPYGAFPTADGSIFIAIENEAEWARFCTGVLAMPDMITHPKFESNSKRLAHRAEVEAAIEGVLEKLPRQNVIELLGRAQIAYGLLNTVGEFSSHPQLTTRNRWRDVQSPEGILQLLLPPVTMGDMDPVMGPVPALGEHTHAILDELGIDSDEAATLERDGVV